MRFRIRSWRAVPAVLVAALFAAILSAPAAASCPTGPQLRVAAQEQIGVSPSQPGAAAYSILTWDAYTKIGLLGDADLLRVLSGCYSAGHCGVPQNGELAELLESTAKRAEGGSDFQTIPVALPKTPPATALSWARATIGGACATARTTSVRGMSVHAVSNSARQTVANVRPDVKIVTMATQADRMEASIQAEIGHAIDRGDLEALSTYPLGYAATMEQAAAAVDVRMNYWRQPGRVHSAFGLSSINSYWLEQLLPYVSSNNRTDLERVIRRIRPGQQERAAAQQTARDLARMNENIRNAFHNQNASASSSSGMSSYSRQQWDAYLNGKANRAPCSVSNPCGLDSQFRANPN